MSNLEFLFAAVAVVWVLLFLYLFLLSRQIGELRGEIESLRAADGEQRPDREREPAVIR